MGELEAARRELAAWLDLAAPDGAALPAPRRGAHRLGDRAGGRPPRRGRGQRAALPRLEELADGRDPSESTASRCSRIRASRGAWRARSSDSGPRRRDSGRLASGLVVAARRARDGGRGSARACAGCPRGLEPFRDALWLASLTYLTDACAALGDEDVAGAVRPELEPLAGTTVVVGHGVACYGAADRYLGMLAATLRDWDRAEAHFEAALELNRRMGAPRGSRIRPMSTARMLLARGRAEDAEPRRLTPRRGRGARRAHRDADAPGSDRARSRDRAEHRAARRALPREVEILRLVARGLSNRQIGEELFISEHTAANHVRSILRKTSCANRTEAATYAHRHGLADDPAQR